MGAKTFLFGNVKNRCPARRRKGGRKLKNGYKIATTFLCLFWYNHCLETRIVEKEKMNKIEFVTKVGKLLTVAKPHLIKCEYVKGTNGDEYVAVTCENGAVYHVNITANSLAAIAAEVFTQMMNK
jgi:hypothetical protein